MNEEMKNVVFNFCYEMAVNDAMNRVSDKGEKDEVLKNDEIKNIIKEYVERIIKGEKLNFCNKVKSIEEIKYKDDKSLNFSRIQKLINMTVKYVYMQYYDNKIIRQRFGNCGAPMDSYMIQFVYDSYLVIFGKKPEFRKGLSWSTLKDETEYNLYQDAIDTIIMDENIIGDHEMINRIEFDYMFWDAAKSIYGKNLNKDQRNNKLQEIWGNNMK